MFLIGSKTSLLSIWCSRMDAIAASRHEEFEGRVTSSGNQAELYPEMNADSNSNRYGVSKSTWGVSKMIFFGILPRLNVNKTKGIKWEPRGP